jgi:signal transduction histidine kinase
VGSWLVRQAGTSLRLRLLSAFALAAIALLTVSALALLALDDMRAGGKKMAAAQQRASAVIELSRSVVELQRNVQLYSHTGHSAVIGRVEANLNDVHGELVALRGVEDDERVERILAHLELYRSTFELAVDERGVRNRLVRTERPETSAALRYALERHRAEVGPAAREVQSLAILIDNDVLAYLDDPDYTAVRRVADRTSEAIATLEAIVPVSAERSRTIALLRASEAQFSRIAQATRGYLYLTNVVMAAEARELTYVAERLRRDTLADAERITRDIDVGIAGTRRRTIVSVALAIILGLLVSAYTASSVSRPIASLTETFRRLAAGDESARVPFTERSDEIGVMARAAAVFQSKNQQTETLLAQARDLTEALQANRGKLERTNEELEQFVHTVSHDLKSPIVTTSGFIQIMEEEIEDGNFEAAALHLPRLASANRRMKLLVEDLLDLSRVGRIDTELATVDLDDVVTEVVAGLDGQIRDDHVRIEVGPLPTVDGNASRLTQVFDNLITNAIKYGRRDDGVQIEVGARHDDDGFLLFVRDDGHGIQEQFHDRVFKLFQRLDTKPEGTGIGLSIVQKIVKSHGGRIWIDSKGDDTGCTFWVHLPARREAPLPFDSLHDNA